MQQLEKARIERRQQVQEARKTRSKEEERNIKNGNPGDIDFQKLIAVYRKSKKGTNMPHSPEILKICVALRKRPISEKEIKRKDHDCITVLNPLVTVHHCRTRVDGISKYLDNGEFQFDHAFTESETTEDVYEYTARPLVPFVLEGGCATVFAYGQTGSGKTYTMVGIQRRTTEDLFQLMSQYGPRSLKVYLSFYEIYGGRCQDLLNNRNRVEVREDGRGEVHIVGLNEELTISADHMLELIERANGNRTTHVTELNDTSSRSHAICQITLRDRAARKVIGKLSLIDLAGSERGADTKENNRQRRLEGAEINKSLLALKECIRSLDSGESHVPYRASKLTLVLKDSFTRESARTVMIATVSPGASHSDHTQNTLRYADRVKHKKVGNTFTSPPPSSVPMKVDAFNGENKGCSYFEKSGPNDQIEIEVNDEWNEEDEEYLIERGESAFFPSKSEEKEQNSVDFFIEKIYSEEQNLLNKHIESMRVGADMLQAENEMLKRVKSSGSFDPEMYISKMGPLIERNISTMAAYKQQLEDFKVLLKEEEAMAARDVF